MGVPSFKYLNLLDRRLIAALLASTLCASEYTSTIENWRADREARLKAPDGWLSVAGLVWLKPGDNVLDVGSGKAVIRLSGDEVSYLRGSKTITLKPDSDDFVGVGSVKLFIIHRGNRYGVRIKNNESEFRRNFTRLSWYPVDPSWRIRAKYVPYAQPRKVFFDSQTGDKQEMTVPGSVEFTRGGRTIRMMPVLEDDQLFFVFRDTTAGKTTYPAARFLYTDLPKAGVVELDFNKAYNPPCAFTPYATCPLPPKENRLSIAVEAGEKKYSGPAIE